MCKQKDCINWHIASAGIEICLREQNHVIKKFYAKPKVFVLKFHTVNSIVPSFREIQ